MQPYQENSSIAELSPPRVLMHPGRAYAIAHVLMLAGFLVALAFATQWTFRFQPLRFMDHYRYEANCWAYGRLGACAIDGSNLPYCIDCSYYNGKAYTGYGPLPALLQLVTDYQFGIEIPTPFLVFVLSVATVYVQFWLTRYFLIALQGLSKETSTLVAGAFSAALFTCNPFIHNVVVAYSWAQSIAAAQLFLVTSTFFLIRYARVERTGLLLSAGAFLAAAGLSKQNYLAAAPVALLMTVVIARRKRLSWTRALRGAVLFALPVLLAISILLIWNYARFDDPFQTGSTWVNATNAKPNPLGRPSLHRIPYNIWNHFLAPFEVQTSDFPFLLGRSSNFGGINPTDGSGGLLHDSPMFALWFAMPVLLMVPAGILWAGWRLATRALPEVMVWWLYLGALGASVFAVYLTWDASWVRYQYDLLFSFALVAASVVCTIWASVARRWRLTGRRTFVIIVTLVFVYQVGVAVDQSFGLLFSRKHRMIYWPAIEDARTPTRRERAHLVRGVLFDGLPLRYKTPRLWDAPEKAGVGSVWCVANAGVCYTWNGYRWRSAAGADGWSALLDMRFPVGYNGLSEPVAVFGDTQTGVDAITVSSVRPGHIFFSLHHPGVNTCTGYEVAPRPGELRQVSINLDPLFDRATVHLDGALVMECEDVAVFDHRTGPVVFGKADASVPKVAPAFSGDIYPVPARL